ncbi:AI-2E family transporter [Streptosporangiaceae bacterium NEAU-GS5]|nr:AI-2E family transporter [Streptosporangiaceae bacterium NEAU-GS5]
MPPILATAAAWSWRLIVIGVIIYVFWLVIGRISFVALPVAIAFLLTALLFPVTSRLRRAGFRPIYATWLTMLLAFAVLGGIGFIIGTRANDEFPRLVENIRQTAAQGQDWLVNGPLHLKEAQLQSYVDQLTQMFNQQPSQIAGTVLTGATAVVEVLASIVLLLFVTFFFLKDGDRIWSWFLRAFGGAAPRMNRAGRAAWRTLSHYVQGTVAVAAIHGVIIGVVLAGMRVPLWAPLAVLIFLASFIPIVGIFFAGAICTLVVFGSQNWVYAVIFVGILIVEQQLENHVLQPLIVGRALEFHPLAIILVLAVGGVVGGIAGAAIAVPVTAVIYRALPELRRDPPEPDEPPPPEPPGDTPGKAPEETTGRESGAAEAVSPQRNG